MTEQEFHNQRQTFAYFDGRLNFGPKGLSHYEWLVDGGLFSDVQFQDIVRGYKDDSGVYFYAGDFETNEYVETIAKSCMNYFDADKPIFCGLIKGVVGQRWKPVKQIR